MSALEKAYLLFGAGAFVFWLLVAPRRRTPLPPTSDHVSPAGASGRPGPPEGPLALPYSLATMDRLWRAGYSEWQIHEWWNRRRPELGDATPNEAAQAGGGRFVLELAERDAACVEAEREVAV